MKNINTLFEDACAILDDLAIPYSTNITLKINYRAKTRWGRSTRSVRNGIEFYVVEISDRLLKDDVEWESAMNTMIHEVLHCYRKHRDHTGDWKKYAELINREYPIYNITRCTSPAAMGIVDNSFKYAVVCQNCGITYKYRKRGKAIRYIELCPGSCNCGRCKSNNLKVEVL